MNWPSPSDFREVRRGLPALAAVLFSAAVLFPMWHIHIQAVQYPQTVLHLQVYAYPHITGDYTEVARLNHYVGFYYPDPVYWQPNYEPHPRAIEVPEWSAGPFAFVGVSLLSVFVAVAPTTAKLVRGLKWQLVGTVAVFTIMLADIQYRLYQAGHTLDPDAPVMGVEGFTPPLWGQYQVANITSRSHFGAGVSLASIAIGLLVVAYYYRDTPVTVDELPARALGRANDVRNRVLSGGDADAPSTQGDP
jgi:hypothetical protein